MADTLALFLVISLVALGTSSVDPTLKLFQDTQHMPILLYECYRTGVTIEPENTVNFTILLDATQSSNNKGFAGAWYDDTRTQYKTSVFDYEFDNGTRTIKVRSSGSEEQLEQLQDAYNGLAYYWKLTITTDNNRVVYKIYDVDSRCGNAAALLKTLNQKTKRGFVFSRDVPEPKKQCKYSLLCAK